MPVFSFGGQWYQKKKAETQLTIVEAKHFPGCFLQLFDAFSKIMFLILQSIFLPIMPCWEKQFRKQQHQTCPGQKRK
jgi:hypothetical protein